MLNLHARCVARAAEIVGGVDVLAAQLAIAPEVLGRYVRGESVVPPGVFLRATEIVTAASLAEAAKAAKASEPEHLQ